MSRALRTRPSACPACGVTEGVEWTEIDILVAPHMSAIRLRGWRCEDCYRRTIANFSVVSETIVNDDEVTS